MKSFRDILSDIVLNARVIPDPLMGGTADVYAVPLDDIDKARELLCAKLPAVQWKLEE